MRRIYADNAATTKMSALAMESMIHCMQEEYGNPSSLHTVGQTAAETLAHARAEIATALNCRPAEIYFTSGGTEGDNQAIRSAALMGAQRGKKHIVSSKFEHHGVLHTLQKLEREGFEVTLLDVHADGLIRLDELRDALRDDTALVTIMYANNEIGTIQPIEEIGNICIERGVLFHSDAVQAAGHLSMDVRRDNLDMLCLSAHKFHGPKGIGALYVRRGVPLLSLIEGGAQERGKRAGTENIPAIVSMAAALTEAVGTLEATAERMITLRDRLIAGLGDIPHSALNGDTTHRLPNNVSFCFEGIEGESLLLLLDAKGVCASSGSACTSGSLDPSHVLLAIGRPHEVAHGSLRLSISGETTQEDIDVMVSTVAEVVAYLRSISPVWHDLQEGKRTYVIQ